MFNYTTVFVKDRIAAHALGDAVWVCHDKDVSLYRTVLFLLLLKLTCLQICSWACNRVLVLSSSAFVSGVS